MRTIYLHMRLFILNNFISLLACICIISSLFLTSCGNDNGPSKLTQNLRLNLATEPPSLDPRTLSDSTSSAVNTMLYEGLTRMQPDGKPGPGIAEEIEISKDLKTYRFTLRDCTWTNGDPVSAYDFEYAWKEILNSSFEAPNAYKLYVIKNAAKAKTGKVPSDEIGVQALDEKTLVVTLKNPTPYFLELTASQIFYPVNRNVAQRNPNWASKAGEDFVTNGPFTLQSWKHHNEIILTKNQNYWDSDNVKLERIKMVMVNDESTELYMFENKELDWAGCPISRLPSDAIPSLREEGRLNSRPIAGVEYYKFNTERFPFNNVKIRKAFSYAINRKDIIENFLPDRHSIATGIIPPSLSLQETPYFKDGDVEMARELFNSALEEMGITKKELPTITLSYNNCETHGRLAQVIQQQWNEAFGIQVKLETCEWKVHIDKLCKHDFQIGRDSWTATFEDPINFLKVYKYLNDSISGGNNGTQWNNQQYTDLLDKAATLTDPEKRNKILHDAERLIIEEMPFAPIYFMTDTFVKAPKLKDYYISSVGNIDFKWADFDDETEM